MKWAGGEAALYIRNSKTIIIKGFYIRWSNFAFNWRFKFEGPAGEIERPSRPQASEGSRSSTRTPEVRVFGRGSATAPTILLRNMDRTASSTTTPE
jgi:hypothetical protein